MEQMDLDNLSQQNVLPLPGIKLPPLDRESISRSRNFNGIISGPMWQKLEKLNSSYKDTFDWSIYDKLYDFVGDKRPREGVVYKTTLRLVNYHPSCSKCHYAFEVDTYGRGCIHNCVYCYAKDQLTSHGAWNRPQPMPVDLAELRKIFYTVFETDKRSKWRDILEKNIPLRIGSMSDSFMWLDLRYRVTYEFLKMLKHYQYPHIIFTRSDLVAHDEYIEVMDPKLVSIQFSISGDNEELTRKLEPAAPSIKRRLIALEKLSKAGFWTTVRINPLFPTYPDGYFSDRKHILDRFKSREAVPTFKLLDIENIDQFISKLKDARVPSILAGFVRLSSFAINNIGTTTGVNFREFFRPEVTKQNGDKHYSDSEIAFYYKVIQAACAKADIRFNTCYIGNGIKDYFQYQKLWDNKKDCCDAVGNVVKFGASSQEVPWGTREKHSPHKFVAEQGKMDELAYSKKIPTNEIHSWH